MPNGTTTALGKRSGNAANNGTVDRARKRPRVDDSESDESAKEEDPFWHPCKERVVSDVQSLKDGIAVGNDSPEWIHAKVFMHWPKNSKKRVQVITGTSDAPVKFEVEFRGEDVKHIDIGAQDALKLSLKGAKIEEKKALRSGHLPCTLVFDAGFAMMFVAKQRDASMNGKVVDTWKSEW